MSPDPVEVVREVHDRLNRTATGGAPDPRGAAALVPPRAPADAPGVGLPVGTLPPADLAATLDARRSAYRFGEGQPALADLGALLGAALGVQRTVTTARGTHALTRAPSAGGLPSLEAYVVVRGPGDLAPGVHRADLRAAEPALTPVRLGDPTPFLERALDQPEFATRAGAVVALVARLDATLGKYPPRHYRTLHVDAGVALGQLHLAATALGLPACAVMGFDDTAFATLLDLPEERFVAVLLATGRPPTR